MDVVQLLDLTEEEAENASDQTSTDAASELQYVISQKGRTQLTHKGFFYVREKMIRNKVYWRCTHYTTILRCHGRIHTQNGRIVHQSLHNHLSAQDGQKPHMRKLKSKLYLVQQRQQETSNKLQLQQQELEQEQLEKRQRKQRNQDQAE